MGRKTKVALTVGAAGVAAWAASKVVAIISLFMPLAYDMARSSINHPEGGGARGVSLDGGAGL